QEVSGSATFRSSASMTLGSTSGLRWTWVSPEYQPRSAMLIQRLSLNSTGAPASATSTLRVWGKYSFPCSTLMTQGPGGRATVNGWAESVTWNSMLSLEACLRYSTALPSGAADLA